MDDLAQRIRARVVSSCNCFAHRRDLVVDVLRMVADAHHADPLGQAGLRHLADELERARPGQEEGE